MNKRITIPKKLEMILNQSPDIEAIVKKTATDFAPIFRDNKLYFFEDYTDHGIEHIENVLSAAENIIVDNTFNIITPNDVSALILSVLLHDIGMHTGFETFKSIIENHAYDDVMVNSIDSKTWSELWEEYLSEAKKFSTKQRLMIFGDESWEFKIPNLARKNSLDGDDRKLIGEFIRRHHARLSHEISLKGGIVGADNNFVPFAEGINPVIAKIIGIVARSHGMNLRDTFVYLREIGDISWKKPLDVNVIFLMVVLRIADYFQIDASRVNSNLLKLKTFSSPLSILEHDKHLSIESTSEWHDDPESLFVLAKPYTSLLFLKVNSLLKDIQHELDLSWAVLGEIYGKEPLDKQLKIKYRRIISNLNKESTFLKNVNYVPEKVNFEADSELIKLLIAPLYGENPSYGVRELTQNSVDACKEREYEEALNDSIYTQNIEINIYKKNEDYFFTILDNGKGMNLFEIKNYFLKAGSSFRKSLDWKQRFTDDSGKALIERTGRFGVGVLAAFLIGNEIEVTTRSMNEKTGYTFKTLIDTEQIEINRDVKAEIGTKISIKTTMEVALQLLRNNVTWDAWYRLKTPKIHFISNLIQHQKDYYSKYDNPSRDEQLSDNWHKLDIEKFGVVHWHYPVESVIGDNVSRIDNYKERSNYVLCNGILIPFANIFNLPKTRLKELIQISPRVSIFDRDNKLPITLSRNNFDGDLPFINELYLDIYKDLLAKLLCYKTKCDVKDGSIRIDHNRFTHPGVKSGFALYFSKDGFTINYPYIRKKIMGKYNFIKLNIETKDNKYHAQYSIPELENVMYFYQINAFSSISSFKEVIDPYYYYGTVGGRIFLKKELFSSIFLPQKNILRYKLHSAHKEAWEKGKWVAIDYDYNQNLVIDMNEVTNNDRIHSIIVFEGKSMPWYRVDDIGSKNALLFDILLKKYLRDDVVIPYEMSDRQALFPDAFLELEPYMRKYIQ
ncbi:HD domain-containing protein [Spirosoma endbachense]|uniref:HD-CE domain-containing protein n=1 Tax=Spirosoma endbachense TaxID=2666025 RepID=A0A6P1W2L5_9BACT|nr:ATP-binding protein [Spirosoma endbachense]QHV99295.1 hypothetical protein GJR95_31670 [Spirosoma endbachense]